MNITIKVLSTDVFKEWFNDLKDSKAVNAIRARIERIKFGNFGDFKQVQGVKTIYELRIHISKGYRIYYTKQENVVVILLCGGIKDTQDKNIKEAERILNNLKF